MIVGLSGKILFNFGELLTIRSHWYFRCHLTEKQTVREPRELNAELVKMRLIPVGRLAKCCAQ